MLLNNNNYMGSAISYYLTSLSTQQLTDYIYDQKNNLNNYNNNNNNNNNNNTFRIDFIKSVVKTAYQYYIKNYTKCYELYIYIDPCVSESVKENYINNANQHNLLVDSYLNAIKNYNDPNNSINMSDYCLNAGFDLFCPHDLVSESSKQIVIDHKIICCMKYDYKYVSYYLYSRSSTPIKTPLRLANSVGIIDSGYRGNIKAIFDNINNQSSSFNINKNTRHVQICGPNIEYPMKIYIVNHLNELGNNTSRGTGGFGSTD